MFPWPCAWDHCLAEMPTLFSIFSFLEDGSRILARMSLQISPFILPSIIWSPASTICWKAAPHHDASTPKLNCWYSVLGVVGSAIYSLNMVCRMTARVQFWFLLTILLSPSNPQASPTVLQTLFTNGVLHGEHAWMLWRFSILPMVFFETTVPTDARSFWSSAQVALCSWRTLLLNFWTPRSEILSGAPDCGWFMVKWCVFHFRIMAPHTAHKNIQNSGNAPITNAIRMLFNNKITKVLGALFAFTHHEVFPVWFLDNEKPL